MLFKHTREYEWSDEVSFRVNAKGGATLAVQELPDWFFAGLKPGDFFEKRIGRAVCHPKENFCRKLGREAAEKAAKLKRFTVVRIVETVGKREITFGVDGFGELIMIKTESGKQVRLA